MTHHSALRIILGAETFTLARIALLLLHGSLFKNLLDDLFFLARSKLVLQV